MIKTLLITLLILPLSIFSDDEDVKLPAYYSYGYSGSSVSATTQNITEAFLSKDFQLLGQYSPESNTDFKVLTFTRNDLKKISLQVKDRGLLASTIKVGVYKTDGKIEVSLLNPEYIIYAYWREDANSLKNQWQPIVNEVKSVMSTIGNSGEGFGGELKISKLVKYHYMIGMPYFDDPVELKTYNSFEEGLKTIMSNIEKGKANTIKVYEQIDKGKKIAVIGVGLTDSEDGEKHFLPIIGERHIAAMPYEIVLQNNTATILHGRYRFALHWPELSMGQFMKIKSTPGYVEDTMKELSENSSM